MPEPRTNAWNSSHRQEVAKEGSTMLSPEPQYVLASDRDREIFNVLVPSDHYFAGRPGPSISSGFAR